MLFDYKWENLDSSKIIVNTITIKDFQEDDLIELI